MQIALAGSLPCWSGSALRDTMALMAGKVMLDIAATAPAAHIILKKQKKQKKNPNIKYIT